MIISEQQRALVVAFLRLFAKCPSPSV
jgi:hypothetical protein